MANVKTTLNVRSAMEELAVVQQERVERGAAMERLSGISLDSVSHDVSLMRDILIRLMD